MFGVTVATLEYDANDLGLMFLVRELFLSSLPTLFSVSLGHPRQLEPHSQLKIAHQHLLEPLGQGAYHIEMLSAITSPQERDVIKDALNQERTTYWRSHFSPSKRP